MFELLQIIASFSLKQACMDYIPALCAVLFRELTEMRKSTALSQSVAQEAALSAHQSAKDELKQVMEEQRLHLQREKDSFVMQVSGFLNLYIFKYISACVYTLP